MSGIHSSVPGIMLVAGGTGGHVFPALAVALELQAQCKDCSLSWVGTTRSRERELCENHAIAFEPLAARGMHRGSLTGMVSAAAAFIKAFLAARRILARRRPDVLIAFGGYVCAPALLAARLRRIPYLLQEQNSIPGLVNRLFAAGAKTTFLGMSLAQGWQLRGTTIVSGNPVRPALGSYSQFAYPEGLDPARRILLICGGSQGASSMNRVLLDGALQIARHGIQIVWQTGEESHDEIRRACAAHANVFVFRSLADLYPYYACSRCVVGRAGAATLSEIAYFGLPCVLIPLPWAAENHQWLNAGQVAAQGWGVRIAQDDPQCAQKVCEEVMHHFDDAGYHEKMSSAALDHSPVNAATQIARNVLQQAGC